MNEQEHLYSRYDGTAGERRFDCGSVPLEVPTPGDPAAACLYEVEAAQSIHAMSNKPPAVEPSGWWGELS